MLVFVGVIAITATVACGAPCPEVDEDGLVNCADQNLTTVPQIPEGVIKLYVGNIKISVRSREQMSISVYDANKCSRVCSRNILVEISHLVPKQQRHCLKNSLKIQKWAFLNNEIATWKLFKSLAIVIVIIKGTDDSINPRTAKGGGRSNGPPIGFSDLNSEALKQSKGNIQYL